MPRNISGTANRVVPPGNSGYVPGTDIIASEVNGEMTDIYTMATQSIATTGVSLVTASIPMNNNKITGLAPGTVAGNAVEYAQWQASIGGAAITHGTQIFTSNGNFTVPAGITTVYVQMCGGGGAGGGTPALAVNEAIGGGGGGGGGAFFTLTQTVTPSASMPVVVGTGGAGSTGAGGAGTLSSFGSFSAPGGAGGGVAVAISSTVQGIANGGQGGVGGTPSSGGLVGQPGTNGAGVFVSAALERFPAQGPGNGGNSLYAASAIGADTSPGGPTNNGYQSTAYGCGGGGASCNVGNAGAVAATGGSALGGIVIIQW